MMGQKTSDEDVTLSTFDNFHRVYSVHPHHLPEIQDWKFCNESTPKPCTLDSWTVTENYYHRLSEMDTGFFAQAAIEQKSKMLSA